MKKTLLIAILLIFSAGAYAQKKRSYVLDDFRGIKWGSHIDSISKNGKMLSFISTTEVADKNAYVLNNDDTTIGTVSLTKVYYIFNKQNRFTGVILIGPRQLGEQKQFGEMKFILSNKFGEAELREVPGAIQYYWNIDNVRITLDDQESQGMFTVEFFSDYERSESKRQNINVDDF